MKLRNLLPKDKEKILDILKKIHEIAIFKKEEVECAVELLDSYLHDHNQIQPDYEHVVCVDNCDNPLGYSCFGKVPLTDAVYDLYWIAVDPIHKGKGIGKKIMNFIEQKLIARKTRKLLIETSSLPIYLDTREFYKKIGYLEISRIKNFYSLTDDKITFEKCFY